MMIASKWPLASAAWPLASAAPISILLALAACSSPSQPDGNTVSPAPTPSEAIVAAEGGDPQVPPTPTPSSAASATPSASETVGGDGSPIRLSPLSAKDIAEAALEGELACSFAGAGAGPLLLAKGNVASKDRAFGVIKVGDYVERVSAPGGYDGMLRGGAFAGKGTDIKVALTGAATGGGESPPRPATLTYMRADGASRVFRGSWTCGP